MRLDWLQRAALRASAALVAPGGRFGSLLVLIYHRVLARPDPLLADEPDTAAFAAQMDLIGGLFNVLPLPEAARRLASRSLPPRAVCITFDDGYANNADIAAPLLAARGMPATFFVATGFLDGGRMWNDTVIETLRRAPADLDLRGIGLGRHALPDMAARRQVAGTLLVQLKYLEPRERLDKAEALAAIVGAALPRDLMMSESQVRQLRALGMDVGAHSVTHPILAGIDEALARREIEGSRSRLEDIVGAPVQSFAYPNGRPGTDYLRSHVHMVRAAGFQIAVSTAWGAATVDTDPLQVPRVAPWDRSAGRYALRMLKAYTERRPATV
jgi:peptidoglycan/xylan/chitin deacetylase (PgdA/CDA1 family)